MVWSIEETTKKKIEAGDYAENIVRDYLMDNDYGVWKADFGGAHDFDFTVFNRYTKTIEFLCDVKCKVELESRPETGIDYHMYLEYKAYSEANNIDFKLFFCDYRRGEIYYQSIKRLDASKTARILVDRDNKKCIYWNTEFMNVACKLSTDDIKYISERDVRNSIYSNNEQKKKQAEILFRKQCAEKYKLFQKE